MIGITLANEFKTRTMVCRVVPERTMKKTASTPPRQDNQNECRQHEVDTDDGADRFAMRPPKPAPRFFATWEHSSVH